MAGKSTQVQVVGGLEVPDVNVVSCHAFRDEEVLAVCPNTEDILIFRLRAFEFQRTHVLKKHMQRVTGLAWSCNGRLVSCSEDRTAVVWEWNADAGTYRSVLVELRAPRAALCVAWAPNGTRFAVGLSSRDVAVCYYEGQVGCWVALKVGKAKAAVGALAWHPSSQFLATGSTDCRCMVYDVSEDKMLPPPGQKPFGEMQICEDAGSWVNSVAFSPKGNFLAILAQDSTVRLKELSGGPDAAVTVVRWKGLPFLCGAFVSEKCFVACGFDCVPVLLRQSGGLWEVCGSLDTGGASATAGPGLGLAAQASDSRKSFDEAKGRFRGSVTASSAATRHSNTITGCSVHIGGARFSTSGLDGQVVVWELLP